METPTNVEMEQTAEPGTQRRPLEAVAREILEISTLPQIALMVIEVAKNPDAGAADLRMVVEGDPALSARVIRMVNSAAYALRSHVTNLHQAISYLGFNQVRNLAMTASVSELFRHDELIGTYQRSALWRHLLSVGICARLVAIRCKIASFEDAFLAGLLHDVGIILEDQHLHASFCDVLNALSPDKTLAEVEQAVLGFDHTALGEVIAEKWKFPPTVKAAIRFHHGSHACHGPGVETARCVEVANVICSAKGITSVGMKLVRTPLEAFRALGFRKEDIVVLADDLDRELSQAESLFEL